MDSAVELSELDLDIDAVTEIQEMLLSILGVEAFLDRLIEFGLDLGAFELLELLGLKSVFGLGLMAGKATKIMPINTWSQNDF